VRVISWQDEARHMKYISKKSWVEIISALKHNFPDKSEEQVKKIIADYFKTLQINEILNIEETDIDAEIERKIAEFGVSKQKHKDGSITKERMFAIYQTEDKDDITLMRLHGYDPDKWECTYSRQKIWNAYSKQDGIVELCSSSLTVKLRVDGITIDDVKEMWNEVLTVNPAPYIAKYHNNGETMAIFSPADPHFGKLAWGMESGESYDHKIAKDRYINALHDFLDWATVYKPEKILFPWTQDFFHIDNEAGTTSGGTAQDVDGRTKKITKFGLSVLVTAFEELKLLAPVSSFYTRSNHAELIEYCITLALEARYINDENVNIDVTPSPRHYEQYGASLLGFSHGAADDKRIISLMQTEAGAAWGVTKYHDWFTGHLHSKKKMLVMNEDEGGITRYWLPSMTSADAWHSESGFLGAIKSTQSFIYHKEHGLIHTHEYNSSRLHRGIILCIFRNG